MDLKVFMSFACSLVYRYTSFSFLVSSQNELLFLVSLSWTALLQVASIWEKHTHYLPRGHQELFDQRSRQVFCLRLQWSTSCPAQTPAADLALPLGRSCHLPCLLPLPPLSRPPPPHHCQVGSSWVVLKNWATLFSSPAPFLSKCQKWRCCFSRPLLPPRPPSRRSTSSPRTAFRF